MVAQNMLRMYDVKKGLFREKKIGFDDSFDATKCLQQIEIPDLLHMCAHCSELSSEYHDLIRPHSSLCTLKGRRNPSTFCWIQTRSSFNAGASFRSSGPIRKSDFIKPFTIKCI